MHGLIHRFETFSHPAYAGRRNRFGILPLGALTRPWVSASPAARAMPASNASGNRNRTWESRATKLSLALFASGM
jgi:hypothetical protein